MTHEDFNSTLTESSLNIIDYNDFIRVKPVERERPTKSIFHPASAQLDPETSSQNSENYTRSLRFSDFVIEEPNREYNTFNVESSNTRTFKINFDFLKCKRKNYLKFFSILSFTLAICGATILVLIPVLSSSKATSNDMKDSTSKISANGPVKSDTSKVNFKNLNVTEPFVIQPPVQSLPMPLNRPTFNANEMRFGPEKVLNSENRTSTAMRQSQEEDPAHFDPNMNRNNKSLRGARIH